MTQPSGALFERLLDIMHRLRGPGGCPWDREQTPTSLKPYLLEEAYEVLEAIEVGDAGALRDELGDLLLQVVFHAEVAAERGDFAMADVLARLIDKMVRRHPHVFGEARAETSDQVVAQWEAIKQREAETEGQPRSVIAGVPRALPALLRAQRMQGKAAREEQVQEAAAALAEGERERVQEELGDVLFSLVNVARLSSIDAEDALQRAIEKFQRRFTIMESELIARGKSVASVSSTELEQSWEAVKAQERSR